MEERTRRRQQMLLGSGVTEAEALELLAYNQPRFALPPNAVSFPLPDEPFVETWKGYADAVAMAGSILPLRGYLVQLAFPIEAGMSSCAQYRAATRSGMRPPDFPGGGVVLHSPERCQLLMHPSAAGTIPVLIFGDRRDFVTFVQALSKRNEPVEVPASMGAAMIAGYNNWHRIELARERFQSSGGTPEGWPREFARIKQTPQLYQDRFILLSSGAYSGVTAHDMGLEPASWNRLSLVIRREHECAHYFTKRVLSSMQNNLLDELMADYAGIAAARGSFCAEWMLRFLGLEAYPSYRAGSRLENYRGSPPLSDGAVRVLRDLVHEAARNLETFDSVIRDRQSAFSLPAALMAMAEMTLEEVADGAGPEHLAQAYWKHLAEQPSMPAWAAHVAV